MFFGGLQKNSFIDYPKKLSCVLFISGCNFSCPYCHNPELVNVNTNGRDLLHKNDVFDFLKRRKSFLDGVVISGGEPTLSNALFSICKKIKKIGYPVKIDTNGSRPHIIRRLIDEGLVDYIAMDIKTDPYRYSPLIHREDISKQILASIRFIMDSRLSYEFRTTCLKPFVDLNIIEKISNIIEGASLYVMQRFCSKKVLNPGFFIGKNPGFSEEELMDLKSTAEKHVSKCILR